MRFAFGIVVDQNMPWPEMLERFVYAERLHWGSDYPVVRRAMTYQQSLEAVRTFCDFIPPADMARVLGDSLWELLSSP